MLVRTLVSIVLLPLLLAVIYIAPSWVLPCIYAVICAIALYELLYATGIIRSKAMIAVSAAVAAGVPFWFYFGRNANAALCVFTLYFVLLFFIAMLKFKNGGLTFEKIACALFAAFIVPAFLSFVIPIANGEHGKYVVLLPFMVAWMSDTGAYFTGTFFGRHKLCPDISPKKTIEGSIGGILLTVLSGAIYALIVTNWCGRSVSWGSVLAMCAVGSVIGQLGDLVFSLIKREYKIKDYGKIFPGHGGILDRFDSIALTTPFVYVMLQLFPVIL